MFVLMPKRCRLSGAIQKYFHLGQLEGMGSGHLFFDLGDLAFSSMFTSAITLKPMTDEENSINYLITTASVGGGVIY